MLSKSHPTHHIIPHLHSPISPNFTNPRFPFLFHQCFPFSNLKVHWRKDQLLDQSIQSDQRWRLCFRVVKEVLNEPGRVIPLRYLEKRRERLRLNVKAKTFIDQNPNLFDIYYDRIRPKSEPVMFVRPSDKLSKFLEEEKRVYELNEKWIVGKLCKLLMMAKDRVISAEKLVHVKREFGFPNDFLTNLVPRYPKYFRLVGGCNSEEKTFLELVSWEEEFAKSVIMARAEEEERLIGIRVRPGFKWELPPGFFIKKEMREWVRDWMELPYISPYDDASRLEPGSREMEKRMVGVLHELLSLSLYKRIPVPILGKFCEDYRFSNGFTSAFTRHSGIFYVSLKGGIKTAVLREAYRDGVLVDRDPLVEIRDRFVGLLEEGWRLRADEMRLRRERAQKDKELMVVENQGVRFQSSDEEDSSSEEDDMVNGD